jgi:cyclopropane-fatty-acyl-phospholipid synthase
MGDRIEILCEDYRELDGKFDKIVSIEMFEAVGHEFQDQFFRVCADRLRQGGRMLLQTITIAEERFQAACTRTDFIQRYIFPGGALPSNASLDRAVARVEGLLFRGSHEIGHHYATTLSQWRKRFEAVREAVAQLGFDERFIRMWEFYLCYCEAGFREGSIGTVHALIERSAPSR